MWVVRFLIMSFEVSSVWFWCCPLYLLLPFLLLIIFKSFFLCLFLYVCMCDQRLSPAPQTLSFSAELHPQWVGAGTLCVKVHIHMHKCVSVCRGQRSTSAVIPRKPYTLLWETGLSHWPGSHQVVCTGCSTGLQAPSVLTSQHGISKHVTVPELWGSNSGSNACVIEPSPRTL